MLTLGAAAVSVLTVRRGSIDLDEVVTEGHAFLEHTQVWVWITIALVCATGAMRMRVWRLAVLAGWLGMLALLAALRELDLHAVLNPANIHLIGLESSQAVRFRLDWWTDPETPVPLRLAWGGVFLLFSAVLIVPFAVARYPWLARILHRDAFPWLLGVGFGLLVLSYVMDDFLGRPLLKLGIGIAVVEETGELLGQLLILAGIIVFAKRRGGAGPADIGSEGSEPA